MPTKGMLLIISGPSGVGKGAISQRLMIKNPNLHYSVSATTRKPRKGEIDGINYFFMGKEDFLTKINNQEFLEWAEVFGNYYGTPKSKVEEMLGEGKDVVLEIDTQGAMQVKAACTEGIFIFILPPSLEELKNRIIKRGSETKESLTSRFGEAEHEIGLLSQYDFMLVNDDLEKASSELDEIIRALKAAGGDKKKALIKEKHRVAR